MDQADAPVRVYFLQTPAPPPARRHLSASVLLTSLALLLAAVLAPAIYLSSYLSFAYQGWVIAGVALALLLIASLLAFRTGGSRPRLGIEPARRASMLLPTDTAPTSIFDVPPAIADWWDEPCGEPPPLKPGEVLCVNLPELADLTPHPHRFELIDLKRDDAGVVALARDYRALSRRMTADASEAAVADERAAVQLRRANSRIAWAYVLAGLAIVVVLMMLLRRRPLDSGNYATLLIGLGALVGVLWSTPRSYLLPGGLLQVLRPYSRTPRLVRYSRHSHALVLSRDDATASIQIQFHGDATKTLHAPPEAADAILAAWLSTAPPPTEEQVRSLLGISSR